MRRLEGDGTIDEGEAKLQLMYDSESWILIIFGLYYTQPQFIVIGSTPAISRTGQAPR